MPHSVPNLDELNLDCLDTETLEHLGNAFEMMAKYAKAKAEAQFMRVEGEIDDALAAEARCDNHYHQIPVNWRW